MRISRFFIDRPIFAGVVSLVFVILGLVSFGRLPVAQYPEIAPPVINVTGQYPGASAEVVASTVVTPLEQQINGVENMLYITSNATGDGRFTIAVTFELGTNLDIAQVQVQNRVAIAQPRLPSDVRNIGVTVAKASPDLMMVVHLYSPDKSRDTLFISNYASIRVIDVLNRINGVGSISVFGGRDYSMRVWLDPDRLQSLGLTTGDVVAALQAQNVQVASGVLSQPPVDQPRAFQVAVQTLGRLADPQQFADILVKQTPTAVVRLKDVARVELAALDYTTNSYLDRDPAVALGIFQLPGSNALATAKTIQTTMAGAVEGVPGGAQVHHRLQPHRVHPAVRGRRHRDDSRGRRPGRAGGDPVPADLARRHHPDRRHSGVADRHLLLHGGLRLLAQQPVAVRARARHRHRGRRRHRRGGERGAQHRGRPLAARGRAQEHGRGRLGADRHRAGAVRGVRAGGLHHGHLGPVLPPVRAHHRRRDGDLADRVADAVAGHVRAAAEAACRAHTGEAAEPRWWMRPVHAFFGLFNRGFEALSNGYGWLTARIVRFAVLMLAVYGGVIAFGLNEFRKTPAGFIPQLDSGYLIVVTQLPSGASLARTDAVNRQIVDIALQVPGVAHAVNFAGFSGATFTNAPNSGAIFLPLEPFETRARDPKKSAAAIQGALFQRFASIQEALVVVVMPPPVRGIGTSGGFRMMVEDRGNAGPQALQGAVYAMMGRAAQTPGLAQVFSLFESSTPQLYLDIDRTKVQMLGVAMSDVFGALQTYLGSTYVNDFNLLGRVFRVTAQADAAYRLDPKDVLKIRVRNSAGDTVPLGSFTTVRDVSGPYRVPRYNLYPAAELDGGPAPGFSQGQALDLMQKLAAETLPPGFSFEWTTLAYQQQRAGNTAVFAFLLAVVFVFLVLAAQYESLTLPLAVILIVPMCLIASITGIILRGMDNNILDPGRLHRADRAGRQERHPDRRVRQAARGPGPRPLGRRGRGRAPAAAADPDDLARLHLRRRAAGVGHRRRRRAEAGSGHRRVRRHDRRDGVRADLHAGVLRALPLARRRSQPPAARGAGDRAARGVTYPSRQCGCAKRSTRKSRNTRTLGIFCVPGANTASTGALS